MANPNDFIAIPATSMIMNTFHMSSVEQGGPNSQMSHVCRLDGRENRKYKETMTYII